MTFTAHSQRDILLIGEAWDEAQRACEEESMGVVDLEPIPGRLDDLPCITITVKECGTKRRCTT